MRQFIIVVCLLLVCAFVLCVGLLLGLSDENLGVLLRSVFGPPSAERWVDDLVTDVQELHSPRELRLWAESVMHDYKDGVFIATNQPKYWSLGSVVVPDNRIPEWISSRWKEPMFDTLPQVTIATDEMGQPRAVIYGWYLKGLVITGTNDLELEVVPFCIKQATEGVYAYSLEK